MVELSQDYLMTDFQDTLIASVLVYWNDKEFAAKVYTPNQKQNWTRTLLSQKT